MGGSKEFFAQKLDEIPEFKGAYQEHLTYYEELLGHVFFGEETLLGALERLLPANEDRAHIRQYIDFVEDMYANGDDDVQNIDETVLRNAFSYFSEELMRASQSIEKGWGRRDIRIWHKNGKVLYDWSWPPNQAAQEGD